MVLIACSDGTATHTGSVCGGPVAGTLTVGSNSFVTIEGVPIMVEDGIMEIPTHNNPPCAPPNLMSHSYSPNNFQQFYTTISGKKVSLIGDNYSTDMTTINGAGTNSFVEVTP